MGNLKKYLLAFALVLASSTLAHAAATKFTDLQCTNLTVTGTLTNAGCSCTNTSFASTVTFTKGISSSTGTFTNSTNAVVISTAATSSASLKLGGAVASLPTTGYTVGAVVFLTSDNKLYVSTETVVGTQSWQAVGAQ